MRPTTEVLVRTVGTPNKLYSITAALASLLMVAMAGAPASASTSTIKVPAKYHGRLSFAMDATYPPDEFIQNGHIVGFDADLAQALSKVMGVKMSLVDATFDTIIPGIVDGKFDVGNSSFTDTKAREQQVDFIDYFKAGEGFYENANSTLTFNGLRSLCGRSVAVESGTTEQTDAQAQAKRCHVDVESYEDQNEANLAVSDGHADVGFADSQVAAYIVHLSHGQFKLTGKPFSTAPYGFIVAKASGLAKPLFEAVKAIMANGQYKQILDKWGVQQGAVPAPVINGASS
ncbi:MAG: ABC transporter substrate-binding protein [Acidimicrobiales bacterium]